MLDAWRTVEASHVPDAVPGAALLNAIQSGTADSLLVYDQYSWAIGAAYAPTAASRIKAEWLRTRIGVASSLVDAPAGTDPGGVAIDVLSFSYSIIF